MILDQIKNASLNNSNDILIEQKNVLKELLEIAGEYSANPVLATIKEELDQTLEALSSLPYDKDIEFKEAKNQVKKIASSRLRQINKNN